MQKISSILPANSRVTTVDLRNSGTARPGMPSFGREVGLSSVDRRKIQEQSTALKAGQTLENQMGLRSELADPKSQIVKNMADQFFNKRLESAQKTVEIVHSPDADMVIELPPDEGTEAPAVGQYLDVRV